MKKLKYGCPELMNKLIELQFNELGLDWDEIYKDNVSLNSNNVPSVNIEGVPYYEYYELTDEQIKHWRELARDFVISNVRRPTEYITTRYLDMFEFTYGLKEKQL